METMDHPNRQALCRTASFIRKPPAESTSILDFAQAVQGEGQEGIIWLILKTVSAVREVHPRVYIDILPPLCLPRGKGKERNANVQHSQYKSDHPALNLTHHLSLTNARIKVPSNPHQRSPLDAYIPLTIYLHAHQLSNSPITHSTTSLDSSHEPTTKRLHTEVKSHQSTYHSLSFLPSPLELSRDIKMGRPIYPSKI